MCKMMVNKNKRGISPVVATLLLTALVVILALIVLLWFIGFNEEAIVKIGDENIKHSCENVDLSIDYVGGEIVISNSGDIAVKGIEIKAIGGGDSDSKRVEEFEGVSPGGIERFDLEDYIDSDTEEIILTPVLLGNTDSGQEEYVCEDQSYGREL